MVSFGTFLPKPCLFAVRWPNSWFSRLLGDDISDILVPGWWVGSSLGVFCFHFASSTVFVPAGSAILNVLVWCRTFRIFDRNFQKLLQRRLPDVTHLQFNKLELVIFITFKFIDLWLNLFDMIVADERKTNSFWQKHNLNYQEVFIKFLRNSFKIEKQKPAIRNFIYSSAEKTNWIIWKIILFRYNGNTKLLFRAFSFGFETSSDNYENKAMIMLFQNLITSLICNKRQIFSVWGKRTKHHLIFFIIPQK